VKNWLDDQLKKNLAALGDLKSSKAAPTTAVGLPCGDLLDVSRQGSSVSVSATSLPGGPILISVATLPALAEVFSALASSQVEAAPIPKPDPLAKVGKEQLARLEQRVEDARVGLRVSLETVLLDREETQRMDERLAVVKDRKNRFESALLEYEMFCKTYGVEPVLHRKSRAEETLKY
jgi:hypothetical protein